MAIRTLLLIILTNVSCNAQSRLIEDRLIINRSVNYSYYLYLPDTYETVENDWPLLLFLHGGGESGKELGLLKKHGPPKMMAEGYPFPFIVLAPQHPEANKWWDIHAVKELLDNIVDEYRVDVGRIYLTGLSRGGSAAWDLAVNYPDTFAAMAVVCGMAPDPYAHWINKGMPIWVFHGAEDPVIPVEESDRMVDKLKRLGYDVKYTRYEDVGHDAWIPAYSTDALYTWFTQYKKSP